MLFCSRHCEDLRQRGLWHRDETSLTLALTRAEEWTECTIARSKEEHGNKSLQNICSPPPPHNKARETQYVEQRAGVGPTHV